MYTNTRWLILADITCTCYAPLSLRRSLCAAPAAPQFLLPFRIPSHYQNDNPGGGQDGHMFHLDLIGKWDLVLHQGQTRRGAASRTATTAATQAVAEISAAVEGALRHIVKLNHLERFLDWATGSRSSGLKISILCKSRAWYLFGQGGTVTESTSPHHRSPTCAACFGTITISDYRRWEGTWEHTRRGAMCVYVYVCWVYHLF